MRDVFRLHRKRAASLLRGRWLVIVRIVWVAAAALTFGMALIGFALALQRPELAGPHVVALAWARTGVPLIVPIVGLLLPILVAFSATALIVFWHRSDDWVPMLFALALLTTGAVQLVEVIDRANPSIPGPGIVMNLACSLLILEVFLFPDGRFVPLWTRLPVVVCLPLLVYLDFGALLVRLPDTSNEQPTSRVLV